MAVALLAGCAGDADAVSAVSSYVAHADPLPTISAGTWQSAPAGCEGRLGQIERWGIAAGAPELVVAVGDDDCVICVDSYSAVESELVLAGSLDLDVLWHSYVAALQELEPYSAEVDFDDSAVAGDPHPSPSSPFAQMELAPRWDLGDRVGFNPVGGQPHPQPSQEGNEANDASNGSGTTGSSTGTSTSGTGTDMPPPPPRDPRP